MQVVAQSPGVVKMKLSLDVHDVNAGPAVLSQRVLYYALSPSEEIRPSVTGFAAAPVFFEKCLSSAARSLNTRYDYR